jgi:hypothetical protein
MLSAAYVDGGNMQPTADRLHLVIDIHGGCGNTCRAIPSAVQSIENNLSISNMDFFEFAGAVDKDGIFRVFPKR